MLGHSKRLHMLNSTPQMKIYLGTLTLFISLFFWIANGKGANQTAKMCRLIYAPAFCNQVLKMKNEQDISLRLLQTSPDVSAK